MFIPSVSGSDSVHAQNGYHRFVTLASPLTLTLGVNRLKIVCTLIKNNQRHSVDVLFLGLKLTLFHKISYFQLWMLSKLEYFSFCVHRWARKSRNTRTTWTSRTKWCTGTCRKSRNTRTGGSNWTYWTNRTGWAYRTYWSSRSPWTSWTSRRHHHTYRSVRYIVTFR